MSLPAALLTHLGATLLLVALTYNATAQAWIPAAAIDAVNDSLVRKWLLWAYALAQRIGTALGPPRSRHATGAGRRAAVARGR